MSSISAHKLKREGACRDLTPKEADEIFFPGSGGKPTKAKKICGQCPLEAMCLAKAIEEGLSGFWAGTTDKERAVMAARFHIPVKPIGLETIVEEIRPKRVLRRVGSAITDTLSYLDTLKGPDETELK